MIIVLIGKAGAGKDSVANYLHLYRQFHPVCFAYPLKRCVKSAFAIADQHMLDATKDSRLVWKTYTCRDLYQMVGKMFKAEFGSDHWITVLLNGIDKLRQEGVDEIVVSDARFVTEVVSLRTYADQHHIPIVTIRIIGRHSSTISEKASLDISETELDSYATDFIITNDRSLQELYNDVDAIVYKKSTLS